jgi:hypothetical protein
MSFSLVYLLERFFYRIWSFIYNWYVGSLFMIGSRIAAVAAVVNRSWAVGVTFKNLFQPLYQDRTMLGYILGFIFRSFRLLIGALLLGAVYGIGVAVYLAWALIPIAIIHWGFFRS